MPAAKIKSKDHSNVVKPNYGNDPFQIFVQNTARKSDGFNSDGFYQRYNEISKKILDRAIISFFQYVRMSYVGDQAMYSSKSEEVIDQTLSLFWELESGFMTEKLLLKLDIIKFIISHPISEHFPFVKEYRCSRRITTFYYTIGCLIFMEDSAVMFMSSMDNLLEAD